MRPDPDNPRLLLIDDDEKLGAMLRDFLAPERLDLSTAGSGEDGLSLLAEAAFDLVILDIMMPGMSGLDVLKKLRPANSVPVIMLTARGDDIDRIIGLEFGADDYLAKPFNPRELLARIRAILRRAKPVTEDDRQLSLASLTLYPYSRSATIGGRQMNLTGTEFEILRCLLESPGKVVTRDRLSQAALGRRLLPYDRSIDTHISNLRGKLDRSGGAGVAIRSQRGVGYLLVPDRADRE